MAMKPWHTVISPREDLREGKPLDASEFAVHLDHVRKGTAAADYTDPKRFFHRTYLTESLLDLAAQAVRRWNGITTETSPIFNLSTQFGGGKTHSLTLLYHLAVEGDKAKKWSGVDKIFQKAGVDSIPIVKTAVFVGTEFSSLTGRGDESSGPARLTPWGEMAYQLGGEASFKEVVKHDREFISPSGDNLDRIFDKKTSYLLLFDEILNYISKHRSYKNLGVQFYNFLHTLSEFVRSRNNIVLAVSIPASELEMTPDDQGDFDRMKKMLDRLGRAILLSSGNETTEIIRRRLFEWNGLPADAQKTISEYVVWLQNHESHLPGWFPVDRAKEIFEATYPFHPTVISLFARKWQSLPRFQQTRGILRLLALWVSRVYNDAYKKNQKSPLIDLGSAPLDDPGFRVAVFEQLGENRLEAAVTTDIMGRKDSHALRLDEEASENVRKMNLHRRCSNIIFFESNGGQVSDKSATVPEIKLAVGDPSLDIGLIDSILQSLIDNCYYLAASGAKYRFSTQENLIKRFVDRKAGVEDADIRELVENEIRANYTSGNGISLVFFPSQHAQVPDRSALQFVILHPQNNLQDQSTLVLVQDMLRNYGTASRIYKSGLIFAVPDQDVLVRDAARKMLAWQSISDESTELRLEEEQIRHVKENIQRSKREIKESIWKTYRCLYYLDSENDLHKLDLGQIHSSQAKSLIDLYVQHLESDGEITKELNPNYIVKYWPPAIVHWSTKALRGAIFSSPKFPRIISDEGLKSTIMKGVAKGIIAIGQKSGDIINEIIIAKTIPVSDIELSEDIVILLPDEAKRLKEPPILSSIEIISDFSVFKPSEKISLKLKCLDQYGQAFPVESPLWSIDHGSISQEGVLSTPSEPGSLTVKAIVKTIESIKTFQVQPIGTKKDISGSSIKHLSWNGIIPPSKWVLLYNKVLVKLSQMRNLNLNLSFTCELDDDVCNRVAEEIRSALIELGLSDKVELK